MVLYIKTLFENTCTRFNHPYPPEIIDITKYISYLYVLYVAEQKATACP